MLNLKMIGKTIAICTFFAFLTMLLHGTCRAGEDIPPNETDSLQIAIAAGDTCENLVFSPYGAETVAAMMALGAKNTTFDEICKAFSFPTDAGEIIMRARRLKSSQASENMEKNRLVSAEGIWIDRMMTISSAYRERILAGFDIVPAQCDFSIGKESNAETINAWIREKTSGRITALTDGFDPETRMTIINVTDFRCDWLSPFDPALTERHDFTLLNGEKTVVPQMRQRLRCFYHEDETVQCIQLPYVMDEMVMLFVLPKNSKAWNEPGDFFSQTSISRYREEMILETVDCRLPKFAWHGTMELKPIFEQLGIKAAFEQENADFSGMTDQGCLFVDHAIQKIAIEIDESGTQATAATAAVFAPKSPANATVEVMEFHADRPFGFGVFDMKNGVCLFMGRCMNPEKTQSQ